mgnify:CR=1 FL=1
MTNVPVAENVMVGNVTVAASRRHLDEETVVAIMGSIGKIGLQVPITVRIDGDDREGRRDLRFGTAYDTA